MDGIGRRCTKCGECKTPELFGRGSKRTWCKSCHNAYARERYHRDPAAQVARSKRYQANNPSAVRESYLKYTYGIDSSTYDSLLALQGGKCACCGSEDTRRMGSSQLFVDHDHTTGQVRGLLCHPCNSGLGKLGDDLDLAIHRLQQYKLHAETKTQQLLDQHSAEA